MNSVRWIYELDINKISRKFLRPPLISLFNDDYVTRDNPRTVCSGYNESLHHGGGRDSQIRKDMIEATKSDCLTESVVTTVSRTVMMTQLEFWIRTKST